MDSTVKSRPNHYETLGVAPAASEDEIRRAFARRMSLFGAHSLAGGAQICVAYETLRNPAKRQAYDRSIGLAPEPEPQPQQRWSIAGPRWAGTFVPPAPVLRPAPVAETLPAQERTAEAELRPEPRTAPFIASALRTIAEPMRSEAVPEPAPRAEAVPEPQPEPEPEPQPQVEREAPFAFEGRLLDVEEGIDWRRPALAAGGLVLAVALIGGFAGWYAASDIEPAAAEPAVTLAVPPAQVDSAAEAAPLAAADLAQPAREPVRPAARAERVDREEAPAQAPRVRPVELTPAEEQQLAGSAFVDSAAAQAPAVDQAAAETPAAPVVAAKMPLPNAVVARTIGQIGYSCGQVASTTAIEGEAGAFKVTCTSGHSYRAAPVRGRYHFRKWGRQ